MIAKGVLLAFPRVGGAPAGGGEDPGDDSRRRDKES